MRGRTDEHAETLSASLDAPASTDSGDGVLVAGRYRVIELIGSGGMGTVYKAHDTELDEVVALKTLRRDVIETPGALERFKREVKLARKVTHRSIARVFDVGETERGEKFLTMELVQGRSLAHVLAERGPLPPGEAITIGTAIAEALAAAHAAGVVHRDLKPDNVLLGEGGRVVLTDFGVARAMEQAADARATGAGGIVGTPAYMAPEQVDGSPIDARTDLFALGVLLFEVLSGELPFTGETPLAIAAARLLRPPRDLVELRPELPRALVDVVKKALARAPDGRFADAAAMGAALASAISATTLARTPTTPPPRPRIEERRLGLVAFRSSAPDDAWMAEGLAEDLGDALSMLHGVRVRPRAIAPASGEDMRAYARRNDVEALVEGTVRKEGEGFRATLRLVSAQDGFQIWAQRFAGTTGELLRVSDDAARAIAAALAGATFQAPARAAGDAEAVELYLRAKQSMRTFDGMEIARQLLGRAVAITPDDPSIHSALAVVSMHEMFRPGAPSDLVARGRVAAQRALELAPHMPEAHLAMARVRQAEDDDVGAMRELLEAKRLGPSVADVDDLLGRILVERDLHDEAVACFERALWIDPDLMFAWVDLSRSYALHEDWRAVDRVLAELRAKSALHTTLAAGRLALWTARKDWSELARPMGSEGVDTYSSLVFALLRDGRLEPGRVDALRRLADAAPPRSRPRRLFGQLETELRCAIGEHDKALSALLAATDAGLRDVAWIRRCPLLAPIRIRPEFVAAAVRVEAAAAPAIAAYRAGVAAPHAA